MRISIAATAFLVTTLPLSASTLTVGPAGSGAMFAEIHQAIDAAVPGDSILVQSGAYAGFTLTKPVKIVGLGGHVSIANPPLIDVNGIPAGAEVLLAGLNAPLGGIRVLNSAGRVLLSDLQFGQALVQQSAFVLADSCEFDVAGVSVESSELWLVGSHVTGKAGISSSFCGMDGPGSPGMSLDHAVVYIARSIVVGGGGGHVACIPSTSDDGASGIRAKASLLKIVGGGDSKVIGGLTPPATWQGTPGYALDLSDGTFTWIAPSVVLAKGNTGPFPTPGDPIFNHGAVIYGVTVTYPTQAVAPQLAQVGGSFTLSLEGNPASPVRVYAALSTTLPILIDGIDGGVLLDPSTAFDFAGAVLDGLGHASIQGAIPADPALIGMAPLLQSLELGPQQWALTNPVVLPIGG